MVDYRRFLGQSRDEIVPYLGGATVQLGDGRSVEVEPRPPSPGWYRLTVSGRRGRLEGPADAPSLADRPTIRGTFLGGRLVHEGALVEPLALVPEEEPPIFAPVKARRWHGGSLLFELVEFESGVEEAVRQALVASGSIGALGGVSSTLRAAYGLALVEAAATGRVHFNAHEVRHRLAEVANGGVSAHQLLAELEAERARALQEQAELVRRRQEEALAAQLDRQRHARPARGRHHAAEALRRAGAVLERHRPLAGGQLEVVFSFLGERFICVVSEDTLQVIDSGICLGHPPRDELLTLDSLPAVIKEAIDTDVLVVLRFP